MPALARQTKYAQNHSGMICVLCDVRGQARRASIQVWSHSKKQTISLSAAERTCNAPRYTSSIDAAMALLPPHCELSEISRNVCWDDGEPEREWCVTVHQEDEDGYARAQHSAPGDTFALAICAAALKSRSPQP